MKIGFTTDTNLLEIKDPKISSLDKSLGFYLDYIKALEKMDNNNSLKFFISEIVLSELIAHKKQFLENEYNTFKERFLKYSFLYDGELPKSKLNEIIRKEKNFASKLNVLNIPRSDVMFSKIIDYSIQKKPPFYKEDGDAGFKDTLLWESILSSKEIDLLDKFYYFTSDNDFIKNKDLFIKEFASVHKKTLFSLIKIESNDANKRNIALQIIINENKLMETDITRLFDENNILNYIKSLNFNEKVLSLNGVEYKVKLLFDRFTKDDFSIEDVLDKNNYVVKIKIETFNYNYTLPEKVSANLELTFIEKEKEFILTKEELSNVKFANSDLKMIVDNISTFASTLKSFVNESEEELRKYLLESELVPILVKAGEEIARYDEPIKEVTRQIKFLSEKMDLNKIPIINEARKQSVRQNYTKIGQK